MPEPAVTNRVPDLSEPPVQLTVDGRFLQLVPDQLIQLTWVTGAGGTEGAETVVTVELLPGPGCTNLRLTHAGFATEVARDRHAHAWPSVLEHLEKEVVTPT